MKKTILCVDDERIILKTLKSQLQNQIQHDVNVECVESAEEALILIDELTEAGEEIALVISDQIMPNMHGDQLLTKIHKKLSKTNKVLLTGNAEPQQIFDLVKKINLYRYIPKPWEKNDLHMTVNEALNAYERDKDLENKNKDLNSLNTSLEDMVVERTAQLEKNKLELEETIKELSSAQNQLVESEKLASLGQLMAGIAHEINTPLGAMTASVGSMQENFWYCLNSLKSVLLSLSEEHRQLFFAMIQQGTDFVNVLSTKEARSKRREIKIVLEGWEIDNASVVADRLVDMNLIKCLDNYKPLFFHDNSENIIKAAFSLIQQQSTTKNIQTAVKKASKVVYALKSYSRFSQSEERIQIDLRENIETVLVLYQNKIKQGIKVIKNYEDNPSVISCFPDELI